MSKITDERLAEIIERAKGHKTKPLPEYARDCLMPGMGHECPIPHAWKWAWNEIIGPLAREVQAARKCHRRT